MTNALEMSSLLKYHKVPLNQSAIATQKSSYFISLILVNLVVNLTASHSYPT